MTDTLNSDLMLAILAMDAYNRGYNSSLDIADVNTIGLATVSTDSSENFNVGPTRDSGFFAVA